MIHPNLTEWPIQRAARLLPQLRGGVAPLRHDLALTHYLEKQAARRASSSGDSWGAAIRVYARIMQDCLAALRSLRRPRVQQRPRISIG